MTSFEPALTPPSGRRQLQLLALPFFASGLATLAYQVAWQRLLFAAFGVDIESITVIVSAFMLGLGLGALAGGQLADRHPRYIVPMFAVAEFGIGVFGLFSPGLIVAVGAATVQAPLPVVALANILLLLIPTSLMGATLPMLVAFLVRTRSSVGVSIGSLYFINTLGGAAGAFIVGFIAFYYFDLEQVIRAAACINLLTGASVLLLFRVFR